MRYRRGNKGPGGDAFTNRKGKNGSQEMRSAAPHITGEPVEAREEVVAEYAQKIRAESRRIMGDDKPIWPCRCSSSVLVALFIWITIGLFVFVVVTRNDFHGSYGALKGRVQPGDRAALEAKAGSGTRAGASHPRTAADTLWELNEGCKGNVCLEDGGSEAFGGILGSHNGVVGYSNCNAHTCISLLENSMPFQVPVNSPLRTDAVGTAEIGDEGVESDGTVSTPLVTGMKWQCVEYARRYWMLQGSPRPAIFGSVDGAADIWDALDHVTFLDGSTTPLFKHPNGLAKAMGGSKPHVGDLLIYPRDIDPVTGSAVNFPYGHVAVIVGVDDARGVVYIAEQNWSSQPWPGPFHNYSRTLPMKVDRERHAYELHDPYHRVQGWVRYARYDD